MPVSVKLQNNNRIAMVAWENPVSVNDFMKVFETIEPFYKQTKLPIHSIYLADKLTNLPPRAISIYLKDPRSPLVNPMSGITVVVSTRLFIRAITDTAAKMTPAGKLFTAITVEDALARVEAAMHKDGAS
jgi:hypothetical protein